MVPVHERVCIHRSAKDYRVLAETNGQEMSLDIEDALVSRKHAEFFWESGALWARDRGSRNGTDKDGTMLQGWKPGQASQPVRLREGDKVYIGNRVMLDVEFEPNRITVRPGDLVHIPAETADELRSLGFGGLERDGAFSWVKGRNRDVGTYRVHASGHDVKFVLTEERERGISEIKRELASMVHREIKEGPSIVTIKDASINRSSILSQLPASVDGGEAVTVIDTVVHRSEVGGQSNQQTQDFLRAIRARMEIPNRVEEPDQ